MSLFTTVLSINQKNSANILSQCLEQINNELFPLIDKLLLDIEILQGFLEKQKNIDDISKKKGITKKKQQQLNLIIKQKKIQISSIIKKIFPILFSNSSHFRKTLQCLFSKNLLKSDLIIDMSMKLILENLDNIEKIYKTDFYLNKSLIIDINYENTQQILSSAYFLKKNIVGIYEEIYTISKKNSS